MPLLPLMPRPLRRSTSPELEPFGTSEGMLDIVRGLFTHYVEGVEPMSAVTPTEMKKRPDEVTDGGYAASIVRNAPASEDNYFLVPKVVE